MDDARAKGSDALSAALDAEEDAAMDDARAKGRDALSAALDAEEDTAMDDLRAKGREALAGALNVVEVEDIQHRIWSVLTNALNSGTLKASLEQTADFEE